jgi:hypothetical protein
VTAQTLRYWAQQLGIGYGVIALGAYFLLILLMVFPELFFDMFLNIIYVKGIIDIALGRTANWKHLTHASAPQAVKVEA